MTKFIIFGALLLQFTFSANAQTIDDFNSQLPYWGVSWARGKGNIGGYHPSLYTGFAARAVSSERIHIRTARGNQTRVSVILDDETLNDYLYDLRQRYQFYKLITSTDGNTRPVLKALPTSAQTLDAYLGIIESNAYGILPFLNQQNIAPTDLYSKSLETLNSLNPGRVFWIDLDLRQSFLQWKLFLTEKNLNPEDANDQIILINSLLWGRINYTNKPTPAILQSLNSAVDLALVSPAEPAFLQAAYKLFVQLTESKYQFKTLENGQWRNALECPDIVSGNCSLTYPEFTAVYPTGSLKSFTKDKYKNKIAMFATPGLWSFVDSGSRDDVDNIRSNSYYGWAPKMDFEAIGNGFHNPAVRFKDVSSSVKKALEIPSSHRTLWAIKRGGVSSGCLRLALGHVWEMRHIFPVSNEKMKQIFFFGNDSRDFDVFDIDGNGTPEVIGVEYMISYDLQGTKSLAKREGKELEVEKSDKTSFYNRLYGSKNIFNETNGGFLFLNPSTSFPSYLEIEYRAKMVKEKKSYKKFVFARVDMPANYNLYEQNYEKDKVQFYTPISTQGLTGGKHHSSLGKRIVRIMGRIKGCAPTADKQKCGQAQFEQESKSLLNEITKISGRRYE